MITLVVGEHLVDFKSNKIQVLGKWRKVPLELMKILSILVYSNGEPLNKEQLSVNEYTFLKMNNLSILLKIAKLRKLLRDDSRAPKYIESVPGKGYKFIADVKFLNGANLTS